MAKQQQKKQSKKQSRQQNVSPFNFYWVKENYLILFAGLGLLIIGFYLMTFGPWDNPVSLSVSPIILIIAYLVVFPLAILYRRKGNKDNNSPKEEPQDAAGES